MNTTFKFPEIPIAAYQKQLAEEDNSDNKITTSDTLHGSHPAISHWLKVWGQNHFKSHAQRRRLLIFNALFKALEKKGLTIQAGYIEKDIVVRIDKDEARFRIKERYFNKKVPVSEKEKNLYSRGWKPEPVMTGELVAYIEPNPQKYEPIKIKDQKDLPLEEQLNQVVNTILVSLVHSRIARLKREEEEKRYQAIAHKRYQEESQRKKLEIDAETHYKAERIRAYIARAEINRSQFPSDFESFLQWKNWALSYADELDPIISNTP